MAATGFGSPFDCLISCITSSSPSLGCPVCASRERQMQDVKSSAIPAMVRVFLVMALPNAEFYRHFEAKLPQRFLSVNKPPHRFWRCETECRGQTQALDD